VFTVFSCHKFRKLDQKGLFCNQSTKKKSKNPQNCKNTEKKLEWRICPLFLRICTDLRCICSDFQHFYTLFLRICILPVQCIYLDLRHICPFSMRICFSAYMTVSTCIVSKRKISPVLGTHFSLVAKSKIKSYLAVSFPSISHQTLSFVNRLIHFPSSPLIPKSKEHPISSQHRSLFLYHFGFK